MAMQKTAARVLLEGLAAEGRRVFAAWRALVLLRRATFTLPATQRRWSHLPEHIFNLTPILRQMERREEIVRIPRLGHCYEVTTPYATGTLDEYAILMELHPFCALSHASALSFHHLTDDLEKRITATAATPRPAGVYPTGTTVEDWEGLPLVSGTRVARILDRPIRWSAVQPARFFGVGEYRRFGYPLRVTTRERTLLDGLRDPELCGGLENVLRAWAASRDTLDVAALVADAERLDIAVLRQRAGFVMETLGIAHPRLERWRELASRGGSSKLLAAAPYATPAGAGRFSERWKLALNAPLEALGETRA